MTTNERFTDALELANRLRTEHQDTGQYMESKVLGDVMKVLRRYHFGKRDPKTCEHVFDGYIEGKDGKPEFSTCCKCGAVVPIEEEKPEPEYEQGEWIHFHPTGNGPHVSKHCLFQYKCFNKNLHSILSVDDMCYHPDHCTVAKDSFKFRYGAKVAHIDKRPDTMLCIEGIVRDVGTQDNVPSLSIQGLDGKTFPLDECSLLEPCPGLIEWVA